MFFTGSLLLGTVSFYYLDSVKAFDLPIFLGTFFSSLLCVFGYFCLYYGFQVGSLSVVSTITAGGALVSVALSLVILKEWPSPLQFSAVGLVISGVILVSFRKSGPGKAPGKTLGVVPAIFSALFFGSYVVLVKLVSPQTGPFLPVFLIRGLGVVLIGGALLYRKELAYPPKPLWKYLVAIGAFDALAFLSLITGINRTMVSIVSPLSSLFTVVTVLLARFVLKEKLKAHQIGGIGLVMAGVILLSL